jgi:hypothetical protein
MKLIKENVRTANVSLLDTSQNPALSSAGASLIKIINQIDVLPMRLNTTSAKYLTVFSGTARKTHRQLVGNVIALNAMMIRTFNVKMDPAMTM